MRPRRSRLRDKVRRLFNPTTTPNDCSVRYVGRVVMPGTPLRPVDGATMPLPVGTMQVVRPQGYRALRESNAGAWTGVQPGPQYRANSQWVAL